MTKAEKTKHISIPHNKAGVLPVHVRGVSILPISGVSDVWNTYFIRKSGLRLAVIPGTDKTASGNLFWNDGESIDTIGRNQYNYYTFDLQKDCTLEIKVEKCVYETNHTLTSIVAKKFKQ